LDRSYHGELGGLLDRWRFGQQQLTGGVLILRYHRVDTVALPQDQREPVALFLGHALSLRIGAIQFTKLA